MHTDASFPIHTSFHCSRVTSKTTFSWNMSSDIRGSIMYQKHTKNQQQSNNKESRHPKHYLYCIWLHSLSHQPLVLNMLFEVATFICFLFAKLPRPVIMCSLRFPLLSTELTEWWWWWWCWGDVRMCCCGKPLSVALSPSCLFPPPSAPIPLLLTMLHIINQLWVGLPCKYPNESSFIKWLNGPDKSPNEEINNSVIVTLLILIRSSCSALIPAKKRPFFTVFSSACQQCCRFFFCPWSFEINDVLLSAVSWKAQKPFAICGTPARDAALTPSRCLPWRTSWFPNAVYLFLPPQFSILISSLLLIFLLLRCYFGNNLTLGGSFC